MSVLAVCVFVVCTVLSSGVLVSFATAAEPTPPSVTVDTAYQPPAGRRIVVRAGGQLQLALNMAQPGDTIALEPGAIFRGNFILPKKSSSRWIIIRSAVPDDLLPPPGTRAGPEVAPAMPKLITPNSSPVVITAPGAHHYRFIGIEFGVSMNVSRLTSIVALGGRQARDTDTPHHLIIDRCYVHGHARLDGFRGVLLNSAWSAIIDSYISDMHVRGFDSQAVLGYNGPGPFKIVNNYLEGAGENIMFGGADPLIRNLVPSDIEIAHNHLAKPRSWDSAGPWYAGTSWTMKTLLELKNAQRVLIEGNLLEYVFREGGTGLLLTPRNQENRAPWSVVQDVIFRNNIVRNVSVGSKIQGSDDGFRSQRTRRIMISNNLWVNVSRSFAYLIAPIDDLTIVHNTALPLGHSTYHVEGEPPLIRFTLAENILGYGANGLKFSRFRAGSEWFSEAVIRGNVLVRVDGTQDDGLNAERSLSGETPPYVLFGSSAEAGLEAGGTLHQGSPLRKAGPRGADVGVSFHELCNAVHTACGTIRRE